MKRLLPLLLLVPLVALAASAAVTWTAPTGYTDGTTIAAADKITYNLYAGAKGAEVLLQSGLTAPPANIPAQPGVEVCGEVTAVVNGVESDRSNEGCTTKPFPKPNAPTLFKFN